jgi:protein involved in polysaccharide export with SLBB domain
VAHVIRADKKGTKRVVTIDLYEMSVRKNLELNMVIRHGDIVNVPEAGRFSVIGFVREPDSFALRKPTTVLEAIAMARGLIERQASPSACVLKRVADNEEIIIPIDLVAISAGEKPNFYLKSDDVIDVRQTVTRNVILEFLNLFKGVVGIGAKMP